jgi:alkylation response protein AidB-like acyl-CoA dehydrogenase
MTYRTPVRDLMFCLNEVAGFADLAETGAFPECDAELVEAVLRGAADMADEVLAPLNAPGDRAGARLEAGQVIAAPGFRDAYRAFSEAGWLGLSADAAQGGQGLPKALTAAVMEAVCGANLSFSLCPTLSLGAIDALAEHGSERQRALVLPKLVTGAWTGTMNLTEPQAGSDLALVRSRAEPDGEGGFRLYGSKIFITWGDHDCAENIVHLVLARLPHAASGVKGLSLFLAPKRLIGEDGRSGEPNAITVAGLEHKLGIHASPTCALEFEGARAELVGPPGGGLACMFTMMNSARLLVGVQGVGLGERAFQMARAYASERRQGRSPWSADETARLIDQPDVRRMLCLMKARVQAARSLCLMTAVAGDLARAAPTAEAREAARLRENLLTPIAKAWSTDMAVTVASLGLQVHGGMGYIEETGAPQLYRDARILPIYEGANGIQALDLVGRKLAEAEGAAMRQLIDEIKQTALAPHGPELERVGARLLEGANALEVATGWLAKRRGEGAALAGATPFLELAGDVIGGWALLKAADAPVRRGADASFARSRVALAGLWADRVLNTAGGLVSRVTEGAAHIEAMDAALLSA